jgi:hypothetical protein
MGKSGAFAMASTLLTRLTAGPITMKSSRAAAPIFNIGLQNIFADGALGERVGRYRQALRDPVSSTISEAVKAPGRW